MARAIRVYGKSDVGRVRGHNEDAFGWRELGGGKGSLYLVADGMGGHAAGEVAAQLAVETILERYAADPGDDPEASLREAIAAADQRIREAAAAGTGQAGMGTTCVCAVVRDGELIVAHVGDSRAYLIRDGAARRLTADHSWVQEQVRRGELTEAEAAKHPYRNLITQALGATERVEPDVRRLAFEPGDTVLLCTDGLTGACSDEEIAEVVAVGRQPSAVSHQPSAISHQLSAGEADLAEAAARLIGAANEAGGIDNVTVLLIRVDGEEVAPAGEDNTPRRGRLPSWRVRIVVAAIALLLAAAALLIDFRPVYSPEESPTPAATVLPGS